MVPGKKRLRFVQSLKLTVNQFECGVFQLWEHNREINDKRAYAIASYVTANDLDIGPQPLILGVLPDGRHYLLDGQHRLRAGQFLGEAAAFVETEIIIESCRDEEELRKLFRVVNIGTPVPLQYYDEEMNTFITKTVPLVKRRWAAAHSKATSTTRPWFTDISLQVQLGNGRCREALMLGLLTPEKFLAELEQLCKDVEEDYKTNPAGAARRYSTINTPTVYARAYEKGFCAGVVHGWGELVAIRLIEGRKPV